MRPVLDHRRHWIAGVAILTLAMGIGLVGCGEGIPGERSVRGLPEFCQELLPRVDAHLAELEQPQGDRYGGTAVVGAIGDLADGLNAFSLADYAGAQHQTHMHLMTLIRVDEELEPRPYLARSWELSEDGSELTFHLRDDVTWHDGEPTTARDVAFTFIRATDPETAFPNAAFWANYTAGEDGVEVLDDYTVRFHLRPHSEILDTWRAMPIMPRHLLEDVPPSELNRHPFGTRCPVGNGPFVFFDRSPGASWTFVRNPAFPQELGGPPYLDRYVYRVIPEQTTLLTELLTGGVDVYVSPTPDQASRIEAEEEIDLLDFHFRSYVFVGWNARRPHLSDPRVRRALTLGTNRREILESLYGGYGEIANAGVPPFHWGYLEGIEEALTFDRAEAGRLLDQAGWVRPDGTGIRENGDGERLEVSIKYNTGNQQRQQIAEIMQAQLREIGVAVEPRVLEWATLFDQITSPEQRDFDGVVMGWVTELKVDDHDLFHSSKVDQPFQWAGIQDPEVDRLLDTLQVVMDRDEAIPLWHEYQERLAELQPFTYFFYPQRLAGVNRRLQGVHMDVRGEWVSVTDWWIPEEARRGRSR
jgi:peptide/nickel transport system substrate-binding protein